MPNFKKGFAIFNFFVYNNGVANCGSIFIWEGYFMIRNLNPITFQNFGSILPERANSSKTSIYAPLLELTLREESGTVYRTTSEIHLRNLYGKSVLSVSTDGKNYLHFYLDKPVYVNAGVLFYITAFKGDAHALISGTSAPEVVGTEASQDHRVNHNLRIEGIYMFFYQEKEQGFLFSGEAHPMVELTYVDQGSLHSVVDGHDMVLKQGDITIYGPDQWHVQYADMGVAPRFVTISFDLDHKSIEPLLNQKFQAPQQAVSLLQQMLREQELADSFSNDMIISQLSQLLLLLLREADAPTSAKLQTANAVHNENEIIRKAQLYISGHIRQKLSVPNVARQVDVSPSYLTALFNKNLQISPGEYIRRAKLQESKQMIRENNLNFTQIAAALQYSTVHHFSRQFKEKFGITPTEYAKSVR